MKSPYEMERFLNSHEGEIWLRKIVYAINSGLFLIGVVVFFFVNKIAGGLVANIGCAGAAQNLLPMTFNKYWKAFIGWPYALYWLFVMSFFDPF